MCGIAGMAGTGVSTEAPPYLERMISALTHRGPDERGLHLDASVALAHSRLSIIDLADGHQPMGSLDGSVWITFNGEIFNYTELRDELVARGFTFRTRSDTEVLLRLYEAEGPAAVRRLNGQWAFAIWDARD